MTTIEHLKLQRERILAELTQLQEIRRGSVVEQYVESTRPDGSKARRGPYFLYSYKEKGRTVSRRLTDREQVTRCRAQIHSFRRFQELTTQLLEIGQRISDLVLAQEGVKKTSKPKFKSRKTPK